jgi:hypothetical protein
LGSGHNKNGPLTFLKTTETKWSTVDAERTTHRTSPLPSSNIMSNDHGSDDDSSEGYEPEYEPEQVVVCKTANWNITLQVLSVVPPPIEFMSTLHSQQQEISGRQVWTGSLLLAQTLCHFYEQQNDLFMDQRYVVHVHAMHT